MCLPKGCFDEKYPICDFTRGIELWLAVTRQYLVVTYMFNGRFVLDRSGSVFST